MPESQEKCSLTLDPVAEALFQVLDQAGLASTLKEPGQGTYLAVSQVAQGWLGANALGSTDVDLMDGAQAAVIRAAEQQAMAAGYCVRAEHKLEFHDGRRECVAWRVPVEGMEGRTLLTVWQDVGDARRRDAQLQAVMSQL